MNAGNIASNNASNKQTQSIYNAREQNPVIKALTQQLENLQQQVTQAKNSEADPKSKQERIQELTAQIQQVTQDIAQARSEEKQKQAEKIANHAEKQAQNRKQGNQNDDTGVSLAPSLTNFLSAKSSLHQANDMGNMIHHLQNDINQASTQMKHSTGDTTPQASLISKLKNKISDIYKKLANKIENVNIALTKDQNEEDSANKVYPSKKEKSGLISAIQPEENGNKPLQNKHAAAPLDNEGKTDKTESIDMFI